VIRHAKTTSFFARPFHSTAGLSAIEIYGIGGSSMKVLNSIAAQGLCELIAGDAAKASSVEVEG
jgi:hypothetical protein